MSTDNYVLTLTEAEARVVCHALADVIGAGGDLYSDDEKDAAFAVLSAVHDTGLRPEDHQ